METTVPGLFACGELIYGMHGANRLSGNAITETFVTGRIAAETASKAERKPESTRLKAELEQELERLEQFWHPREVSKDEASMLSVKRELQKLMWEGAGPLRTEEGLRSAWDRLRELSGRVEDIALAKQSFYALTLVEKIEMVNMIKLCESIIIGALARRESRGAHTRLDYAQAYETAVSTRFLLDSSRQWTMQEIPLPEPKQLSKGDNQ
jgi:succinate dehydrogenase / fumarate reductase flavoprotein subunit/fumarate reductase (CoM/CoB) subunit A